MSSKLDSPVAVFNSLTKPTGIIQKLWDAQGETLDKYYASMTDKRLVAINLPTGSGKSIIGLVILESWRRNGKRVAIITSSNALCVDLDKRCKDLGIQSVNIKRKSNDELQNRERINNIKSYKRGQAIGIMNYWTYMSAKDVAEPEVLVIDDADNFETVLIQQSSVIINRDSDTSIWEQIWGELSKYKIYQNLDSYAIRQSDDESELIYFLHSVRIAETVRSIILSKNRSDLSDDLFWRFEENKDRLIACPM
ncbi:MAG: DEAD/DEAH box helicase, partial [Thermoproteota archaeon]